MVRGEAITPDGHYLLAAAGSGAVVMSVARAEQGQPGSVLGTLTSPGGATVWVTVRESNALLAFSAAWLRSDPSRALIANVRVGQRPIGLTVLRGGGRILVANSNMHPRKGTMSSLGVVDAHAALAGRPALLGLIQAGTLPREVAMEPGGQAVLITNSASHQLEAANVSGLK
jgi:hypothetical protein